MNNKLKIQFNKFIEKIGISDRHFTNELYETLHTKSGFIAHFNKQGFIEARFRTLADFDRTLEVMMLDKELKELVESVDPLKIAQARYRIASNEAHILSKTAQNMLNKIKDLQSKFNKDLI